MVRIYNYPSIKHTRLSVRHSLVFFLLAILIACKPLPKQAIELIWKDERAVAIQIPKELVGDKERISVRLKDRQASILGNVAVNGEAWVFKPAIPLSAGLSYEVFDGDKAIGNISIPGDKSEAPKLIAIYPQGDTLPENTLKVYLHFSKPMRTGQVLNHVALLDKRRDTMRNVFLDLQPELWDSTGTVLTLWLDPGRIKRDLVLNRKLGNPLKTAQHYELIISGRWKDNHGISLQQAYTKRFVAGSRLDERIDIAKWQLDLPKANTNKALVINIGRSLDHYLLLESISITDAKDQTIPGTTATQNNDRLWTFTPTNNWQPQTYKLKVNTRLEDWAGNNLNKVFDRDITKQDRSFDAVKQINFSIKN
ncbi:MAG: Ig-like domain-containing protein [Bacteroidota bacterium]